MRFNDEHVPGPVPSGEVNGLVKSVSKKDYAYTCKSAPICNYCEKSKCMKREFGVGGIGGGQAIEIDAIVFTDPGDLTVTLLDDWGDGWEDGNETFRGVVISNNCQEEILNVDANFAFVQYEHLSPV